MSRPALVTSNVAAAQVAAEALQIAVSYLGPPAHVTPFGEAVWPSDPADPQSPGIVVCTDRNDQYFGRWLDERTGAEGDMADFVAMQNNVVSTDAALRLIETEVLGRDLVGHGGKALTSDIAVYERVVGEDYIRNEIAAAARKFDDQCIPLARSPAALAFLRRCGLQAGDILRLDISHCVRFHEHDHAIVCLMVDASTGEKLGVHELFLDETGAVLKRQTFGRRGLVCLSPHPDPSFGLGVSCGFENGLAVLLSGFSPIWCTVDAGSLALLPPFSDVALTIFVGGPEDQPAADACARRWAECGREVSQREINQPTGGRHAVTTLTSRT